MEPLTVSVTIGPRVDECMTADAAFAAEQAGFEAQEKQYQTACAREDIERWINNPENESNVARQVTIKINRGLIDVSQLVAWQHTLTASGYFVTLQNNNELMSISLTSTFA